MTYIKICVNLKGKGIMASTSRKAKVIIKDGVSLTSYDNLKFTETTYKKMIKDGKKVNFSNGVIIEEKKDQKKEDIAELFIKDLHDLRKHFGKTMDVTYTKELVK